MMMIIGDSLFFDSFVINIKSIKINIDLYSNVLFSIKTSGNIFKAATMIKATIVGLIPCRNLFTYLLFR